MIVADQETPLEKLEAITGTLRASRSSRAKPWAWRRQAHRRDWCFSWLESGALCARDCIDHRLRGRLRGHFLSSRQAGARVPFGPFFALGALFWIFGGEEIWNGYFGIFTEGSAF